MIRILVVDDDRNLNRLVCSYLNDCGFETKGCLSVSDAYDEMYANLYDLIISDIMLLCCCFPACMSGSFWVCRKQGSMRSLKSLLFYAIGRWWQAV